MTNEVSLNHLVNELNHLAQIPISRANTHPDTNKMETIVEQAKSSLRSITGRQKENLRILMRDAGEGIDRIILSAQDEGVREKLSSFKASLIDPEAIQSSPASEEGEKLEDYVGIEAKAIGLDETSLSVPGKGPLLLGKIQSLASTFFYWVIGKTQTVEIPPGIGANDVKIIRTLQTSGQKLAPTTYVKFFDWLESKSVNFTRIDAFITEPVFYKTSEKDFREIIEKAKEGWDGKEPVVMPIVLEGEGLFEFGHIVTVVIKHGVLYYYDPKGIESEERALPKETKKTLRDRLEVMKEVFGSDLIRENLTSHQMDIHNCGRYILFFLYSTLFDKLPVESFENVSIGADKVEEFGRLMAAEMIELVKTYGDQEAEAERQIQEEDELSEKEF